MIEMPSLSVAEFVRFQYLIEEETGIHLPDSKQPLLVARLSRRLRQLGIASFGDYYDHVVGGHDPHERTVMYDAISTNETRFFREPRQFELLTGTILPRWKALAAAGEREKRVRIWSVGCSTGEEPYSLAMILLDAFDPDEWKLQIDAGVCGRSTRPPRSRNGTCGASCCAVLGRRKATFRRGRPCAA